MSETQTLERKQTTHEGLWGNVDERKQLGKVAVRTAIGDGPLPSDRDTDPNTIGAGYEVVKPAIRAQDNEAAQQQKAA